MNLGPFTRSDNARLLWQLQARKHLHQSKRINHDFIVFVGHLFPLNRHTSQGSFLRVGQPVERDLGLGLDRATVCAG